MKRGEGRRIDLSDCPVWDDHCHPFVPSMEPKVFTRNFNWSSAVPPVPTDQTEDLILYKRTMSELARFLGCEKKDFREIVALRNQEYRQEPKEYISRLFREAKIQCLLPDFGYPSEEVFQADFPSRTIDFAELERLLPCKFKPIFRIDGLIYLLSQDKDLGFNDMLDKYDDSLKRAVTKQGYVGLKTITAYRYGLDIQDRFTRDAQNAYNDLKEKGKLADWPNQKDEATLREEKPLRDFLVLRAIERSAELKVPFQIHTGVGTSPYVNLAKCHPFLLYDALRNEKAQKTQIILVHAGYPYVEEAGYLANQFANVYVDMSVVIPWSYPGIRSKVLQLLELTPTSKLLYGDDGYNVPELFWISVILGKEALSGVLEEMVDIGKLDEDYAYHVAAHVLHENAERLFRSL